MVRKSLVCGAPLLRPKRFNRRRWAKVKFCSRQCAGIGKRVDPLVRIKRNVVIDERGCWLWQLYKDKGGYGCILVNRKSRIAPRVSFELHYGLIPSGLHLHHKCGNRSCINPLHLEPVTPFEHIGRSPRTVTFANRYRTHCYRGHEFTEENTYVDPDGGRVCRKCCSINQLNWRSRKKEKLEQLTET
jgi:hypothetical protein